MDSLADGGPSAWPLRAPQSQRALFDLLALYRPDSGLDALITRIPEDGLSARLVYHVAHRRLPDGIEGVLAGQTHDARTQLAAAIRSAEFRDNIVLNLLDAYPELRRDVMLRLPGQDTPELLRHAAGRRSVLAERLGAGVVPDRLLVVLAACAASLPCGGDVLAECTQGVERLIARAGVRPQDRLMVVIDEAEAVFVGQANRAVARLVADPDGATPEVQPTLQRLGMTRLPGGLGTADLRRLVERVLSDPVLCPANPICATLSHLAAKTASTALLAAAALDIEITTAADQAAWLLERWDVVAPDPAPDPAPAPPWFLDVAEARLVFPDRLEQATGQDRAFCARVGQALRESGRCWVSGLALARTQAGSGGLDRAAVGHAVAAVGNEAVHSMVETVATAREVGDLAGPWFGFGRDGNGASVRGSGWSVLEDHSSWTTDLTSLLRLPHPGEQGAYRLQLDASPFVVPGRLPRQRVGVRVNGVAVAVCSVSSRFFIDVAVPWVSLSGYDAVQIELILPDAARPSDLTDVNDGRRLGLYVRSVALLRQVERRLPEPPASEAPKIVRPEPTLAELAIAFESMGENCELGLVQRKWGAEPLGLLRFASSPLDKLLPALRNRFREMGSAGQLEVQLGGGQEYMVLDRKYGFLYHAWAKVGELTPEEILTREHRRVPFLIRKLTEDLQGGEKIFVYHGLTPLIPQQVRAMSAALRLYGPGKLLWLELADAQHPPGSVEWVEHNVIKGHIDRFAPGENAHDFSLPGWEAVCRAAWRLANA
jgi:hypothetical protein